MTSIDFSTEERELMVQLLNQVSLKASQQNLETMKLLVVLQAKLSANEVESGAKK